MLEKEVENIKQKILPYASGREQILLSEILNWDIPQPLKDYFNIFVERILSEELLNILYSKRFDQRNIEFIEARKRLINTLKNAVLLSYSEFENALDKASKFAINFILRPEWTLAKVIFKNEDVKTTEQIIESLSNFNEYTYYKKLLEKVLSKYQSNEIKLELFQRILRKIDEEVMKNVSIKDMLTIIEPVFKLFKFANDENTVPVEALIIFFNDKGAENIVKELELERDLHRRVKFTINDVEIILKRFYKPIETPTAITESKIETPSSEVKISEPETIETEIEEPQPETTLKLPDLNSLLDEKMKEKFTKKIFKKNELKFRQAIEKLNSIDTWKEASAFIDSIFIENEIDPYSDEAIEFTDFVYRRYIPRVK
jgi:hypothetical protein